jgi:serine/threonine protein kinase
MKFNENNKNNENILNELNLYKSAIHPNIVELYGFTKDSNYIYLIFEYSSGIRYLKAKSSNSAFQLYKPNFAAIGEYISITS